MAFMSSGTRDLKLPIDERTARSLSLGERVTVSGTLFTGRSLFHIRAIEGDVFPPIDYARTNCFFHVGPVMRRRAGEWQVVSLEPTSSIRFERYAGDVVRKFGLRTLIGKTTVGPRTAAALAEVGGVYLSKIGLCGNRLRTQVQEVLGVHYLEELGKTEATWVFAVRAFGPFFVAVDAQGRGYFDALDADVRARMRDVEAALAIPDDFAYTEAGPP
jgi:tartrate/fumarate subfamily iron-sulfur-dependent hydro-lyase beta chain